LDDQNNSYILKRIQYINLWKALRLLSLWL